MFAVPGWSVNPSALKTQTEGKSIKGGVNGQAKKSKKRKRGSDKVEVTGENVGELYRKYVEGQDGEIVKKSESGVGIGAVNGGVEKSKKSRKRKRDRDGAGEGGVGKSKVGEVVNGASGHEKPDGEKLDPVANGDLEERSKKRKKHKKDSNAAETREEANSLPASINASIPEKKNNISKAQAANGDKRSTPNHDTNNLRQAKPKSIEERPEKKDKKEKSSSHAQPSTQSPSSLKTPKPTSPSQPSTSAPSNLTPLQQKMHAKLLSARFRHLNQTLYTTASTSAAQLFSTDPAAYSTYHTGFRAQVAQWPSNPIDAFIAEFKARAPIIHKGVKGGGKGGAGKGGVGIVDSKEGVREGDNDPLPRDPRTKTCRVIDLGCGDAKLAEALQDLRSKGKVKAVSIRSFDLARPEGRNAMLVERADVTDLRTVDGKKELGVRDGSVDVAVCCLSLMGTNWVNVVDEVARCLVRGGEAWVAEVRSRFRDKKEVEKMRKEREGEKSAKKKKQKGKGKGGGEEEEDEGPAILEEIDGSVVERDKDDVDVAAFVEVWKRRGLELKGTPDLGNKMFVKMKFVKVGHQALSKSMDGSQGKDGGKLKFIERGDDGKVDPEEEGKVLKPCVYKTR